MFRTILTKAAFGVTAGTAASLGVLAGVASADGSGHHGNPSAQVSYVAADGYAIGGHAAAGDGYGIGGHPVALDDYGIGGLL